MLRSLVCGGLAVASALPASESAAVLHPQPSHDEPALAHITGKPEIVFAVVTSRAHHGDKAKSVLDTWCSDIYACAFFSDAPNPSNEPTTLELNLKEHGLRAEDNLDRTLEAQLRHVVALKKAREMVMNPAHAEKLGAMKWLVLCTDDTYVFYHNLMSTLSGFNSSAPVYTGNLIPGTEDDDGNGIVNIGGGAVFSKAALLKMSNLNSCIEAARPGGKWWGLMPDSVVGECAYEADVPTELPAHGGVFNQLGCTNGEGHPVHHCGARNELADATAEAEEEKDGDAHDTAEGVDQCSCAGQWDRPASFHPVVERESMQMLWTTFVGSSISPVTNVSLVKVPGLQLEEMTPDQKHWFFRGYDDGVAAGKAAGWQEAHAMQREGRREGEDLGRVKGKAKGQNIGYRHGKSEGWALGEHRGKNAGLREGERTADDEHKGSSSKSDSDAEPSASTPPSAGKAAKKGGKARN